MPPPVCRAAFESSRLNRCDAMALLTASHLRKDISGTPLFDGVSFKLERRDRLALSGSTAR